MKTPKKFLLALVILFASSIFAQAQPESFELNGDVIEYSVDGKMITATGNVHIKYGTTELYCDEVEYIETQKKAHAKGNVRLISNQGEVIGPEIVYDFLNNTGSFQGAKIFADPYYGYGKKVSKESDGRIIVEDGYVTTSDYDKPGTRLESKKIEIYPGDKLIAKNIRGKLGEVPVFYFPWYKKRLDDYKPFVRFVPGYDSDWGAFLLSRWRYFVNDNLQVNVHLDYRERLDFASGLDLEYKTRIGNGLVRTYYTNERMIGADHIWEDRLTPTIERERYKAEFRHRWRISQSQNMIMQYYKVSDNTFLDDYFEEEADRDPSPDTYFLYTQQLPRAILSVRADARVNQFENDVDRLPEIRYDLTNTEIADSGFYIKNTTTLSSLAEKFSKPSAVEYDTVRFDLLNELSYPTKLSIFEMRPFAISRQTYYSNTLNSDNDDSVRSIFEFGTTMSTKFYRIFDVESDKYGIEINRLRHIMTPSVTYRYRNEPTLLKTQVNSFDSIDEIDTAHSVVLSYENKLQTKRNEKTVELVRVVTSLPYRFKQDASDSGFDVFSADVDIRPTDWTTFFFDMEYSTRQRQLTTANFDLYINGDDWEFGLGKRFNREVDDQVTMNFLYRLNQKWRFGIYERFDIEDGVMKEQEYTVTRDLHSWEMDFKVNDTRNEGTEFLLLFRLKEFPDLGIGVANTFEKRESGSSSGEGE